MDIEQKQELSVLPTDKGRLLSLFESFGLAPEVSGKTIKLVHDETAKVEGYTFFYVDFNFDSDGKFVNAGIWE
jgi:hypothetical protein